MPGRFEGMSDAEWELFKNIFPEKARKERGMPATHPRKVLNSMLFIVVTGCRCYDLPRGGQWAAVRHDFKSNEPSHGCKESSSGSSCDGNNCQTVLMRFSP